MSSKASNKPVTEALKRVLANSYVLSLKTQNFHWNVTGPQFHSLHLMFETQYTDLQAANDLVAERIRALGEVAPGTFKAFAKLTDIKETEELSDAKGMIKTLVADIDVLVESLKEGVEAAENANDTATADMLTSRIDAHEKHRWMLKSSL